MNKQKSFSSLFLLAFLTFSNLPVAHPLIEKHLPQVEFSLLSMGYNRLKGNEFNINWNTATFTHSNNYISLELPTLSASSYHLEDGGDNYVSDNYLLSLAGYGTIASFRLADKFFGTESFQLLGDFVGTIILATTALPNSKIHIHHPKSPVGVYSGLNTQIFLEERKQLFKIIPIMADLMISYELGTQVQLSNTRFKLYYAKKMTNMTRLEIPSSFFGAEAIIHFDWLAFKNR